MPKKKKKENKLIKVWKKYFETYKKGLKKCGYTKDAIEEEIKGKARYQKRLIDESKPNANEPLLKQLNEEQKEFIEFLNQVEEYGL